MDLTINYDINIMGEGTGEEARKRIKILIYQDKKKNSTNWIEEPRMAAHTFFKRKEGNTRRNS